MVFCFPRIRRRRVEYKCVCVCVCSSSRCVCIVVFFSACLVFLGGFGWNVFVLFFGSLPKNTKTNKQEAKEEDSFVFFLQGVLMCVACACVGFWCFSPSLSLHWCFLLFCTSFSIEYIVCVSLYCAYSIEF